MAFEGALSRYPKNTTLGIYVVSKQDGYSSHAKHRANSSPYHILLTNFDDMRKDIHLFEFQKMKIEFIEDKLTRLEECVVALEKKMGEKLEEKMVEMVRKWDGIKQNIIRTIETKCDEMGKKIIKTIERKINIIILLLIIIIIKIFYIS